MYKNYFRIGFGGCGCAFVDTFEEHVYRLFRSYLLVEYKELVKLSKVYSKDVRLEMEANLKILKRDIFEEKLDLDNLDNIKKHLGEWSTTLENVKVGMKRSYEKKPVEKIGEIIKKLKVQLRGIKEEYGVWLEALTVDSYSSSEKEDTGRHLYNKFLDDTRQIRINEFEMDILDADGFNHQPELQMLPLSLQEVRNEVYTDLNRKIKEVNVKASRGHFFFLGLGGGTGTGVISPLAQEFSKGARSYFTLGALGGKDDNDYLNSQQPWFRRCFNMLLALNDLIATAKLDGLLLVDNEILMENLGKKLQKKAEIEILNNSNDEEDLKEKLKRFLENEFEVDEWVDGANIVIYNNMQSIDFTKDDDFVEITIYPGSQKAKVIISDGTICTLKVSEKKAEGKVIGTILLGKSNEKRVDEELIKKIFLAFCHTAFDQENLDWSRLSEGMGELNEGKKKPILVPCYASGDADTDTASLVGQALRNGKLAKCAHEKADRVFVYQRSSDMPNLKSIKEKLNLSSSDSKRIVSIGLKENSDLLEKKLQDKNNVIFVIEVKKEGEIKKNEVLIILRNPNISKSLKNRLTIAKNFVYLLKDFIERIENAKGSFTNKVGRVDEIIQEPSDHFKDTYLGNVDKEIPIDGINRYLFTWDKDNCFLTEQEQGNIKEYLSQEFGHDWMQADIKSNNGTVVITNNNKDEARITIADGMCKVQFNGPEIKLGAKTDDSGLMRIYKEVEDPIKEILKAASSFLLPVKQERIYEKMKKVVQRLVGGGAVDINEAINNLQKDVWPIFNKPVFEIEQASASSDEIAVTTMLASDDISNALGHKTVKNRFSTYQRNTLKDLKEGVFVEGSDFDDYILTDEGEKCLSDLKDLKTKLDEIGKGIDNKLDLLFEKVSKGDFLGYSKKSINNTKGTINFPKLLILSLLYTKWVHLFFLDEGDKRQIMEYLKDNVSSAVDADSNWERYGTREIWHISEGASGQIGILIDTEKENNIKKIHVGFFKKKVNTNVESIKKELDNGEIKLLRDALNTSASLPPQYEVVKEGDGYSIKDKGGSSNSFYIYKQDSNSLRVYEDRSAGLNLRVRRSGKENIKLKVYRRR